ncbi:MAG TPA: nickel-dependent lactate racemase [Chloroflexia bacterium]|nr:nickel-dependent lactate racemase [Chloroflexia bacterium]
MDKVRVELAYGKTGLPVELPGENLTVIEPLYIEGLPDEKAALLEALRQPINSRPLRELVKPENSVVIVFCDITRPMPNDRVLPVVLQELAEAGVPRQNITLLNATGSHRPQTQAELEKMLGAEVAQNYRIVNHSAHDQSTLTHLGRTSFGAEVWLDKEYLQADVKILTGFIEPHFFAGFSGGPKMILPGVAGIETVLHAHSARMVGSPQATWGITYGNPIHDEIREGAAMAGSTFSLNVTLNKDHAITNVFAGEVFESHKVGCEFVRQTAMRAVPELFDIVITTNSGYPLDQNLYQAVKGMSAAALVVKPGGAIIAAAECIDGMPNHGNFKDIFKLAPNPAALLELINSPDFMMFDQWQNQVLSQILMKARVFFKNSYLSPEQVRAAMLEPIESIEETVAKLIGEYGPDAKICVLPQGPQTVPYLSQSARVLTPA